MKTLQKLLSMKIPTKHGITGEAIEISPEFRVAVQEIDPARGVRIIVHALGHNSDTLDFWVHGDDITGL